MPELPRKNSSQSIRERRWMRWSLLECGILKMYARRNWLNGIMRRGRTRQLIWATSSPYGHARRYRTTSVWYQPRLAAMAFMRSTRSTVTNKNCTKTCMARLQMLVIRKSRHIRGHGIVVAA